MKKLYFCNANFKIITMNKYFRLSIISIACLFFIFFSSCDKEGIYMPSKKISSIYKEILNDYNPIPKELIEKWDWENKKLIKITYYDQGEITNTFSFHYDKKQIIRIDTENGNLEYHYNKNKLDRVEMTVDGNIIGTMFVKQRTNKLISHVRIERYNMEGKNAEDPLKMFSFSMRLLFADCWKNERETLLQDIFEKRADGLKSEGITAIDLYLKYNLDNVAEEEWIYTDATGNEITQEYKYTHDKYYNPFSGSYLTSMDEASGGFNAADNIFPFIYSANNVMKMTNVKTNRINTYSYTYKDSWPITRTEDKDSYQIVHYYEYE